MLVPMKCRRDALVILALIAIDDRSRSVSCRCPRDRTAVLHLHGSLTHT